MHRSGEFGVSETPEISIVVPTYNDARKLERLLHSLAAVEVPAPTELLIIDDCSTDNTEALVTTWAATPLPFTDVRYLRQPQNGGPGKARNRGLHEARGALLAYTDSDCVVSPQWLRELVKRLDIEGHIGGVGGKVLALDERSMAAKHYVFHRILEPPDALLYLVTCNCIFYRQALLDAGGFPDKIRAPGGEDVAVGILLYKQNWRFAFSDEAIIWHDFRHDLSNFYKTWYNYGYGSSYYVHCYLDRDELYPERCNFDASNWWSGHAIRPTVTGVTTFVKDMRIEVSKGRRAGFGPLRLAQAVTTRIIERAGYLRGWLAGQAAYFREFGVKPFYN